VSGPRCPERWGPHAQAGGPRHGAGWAAHTPTTTAAWATCGPPSVRHGTPQAQGTSNGDGGGTAGAPGRCGPLGTAPGLRHRRATRCPLALACGLTAARLPRLGGKPLRPPTRREATRLRDRRPSGTGGPRHRAPPTMRRQRHDEGTVDGLTCPHLRLLERPPLSRPPWAWCVHPLVWPTGHVPRLAVALCRPHRVPAAVGGVWPGTPSAALRQHRVPDGLAIGHRPRPVARDKAPDTA